MTDVLMTNGLVFPEDKGTGAPVESDEGDFGSGALFGTLANRRGGSSFVTKGSFDISVTVGSTDSTLALSEGLGQLTYDGSAEGVSVQDGSQQYSTSWPHKSGVIAHSTGISDVTLETGSNDLYIFVDLTQQNGVYLRYGTSVAEPSGPSVYLGTANSDGSKNKVNDLPDDELKRLGLTELTGPIVGGSVVTSLLGPGNAVENGELRSSYGTDERAHFGDSDEVTAGYVGDYDGNGNPAFTVVDESGTSNKNLLADRPDAGTVLDVGGVSIDAKGGGGATVETGGVIDTDDTIRAKTGLDTGASGDRVEVSGSSITNPNGTQSIGFGGESLTLGGGVVAGGGVSVEDGDSVEYGTDDNFGVGLSKNADGTNPRLEWVDQLTTGNSVKLRMRPGDPLEAPNGVNMLESKVQQVSALQFGANNNRSIYPAGSGLTIHRSYGEAATLAKIWSPPEAQGGKEATMALVQGDDDDYVYDVYNNAGYTSGTRAAQWGMSLKYQAGATAIPYVFDFDKSALGGSSYVERLKIVPDGPTEILNSPLELNGNPVQGVREAPNNPAATDLNANEAAFVSDRDGTGTTSLLYKDSTGTAWSWDADNGEPLDASGPREPSVATEADLPADAEAGAVYWVEDESRYYEFS